MKRPETGTFLRACLKTRQWRREHPTHGQNASATHVAHASSVRVRKASSLAMSRKRVFRQTPTRSMGESKVCYMGFRAGSLCSQISEDERRLAVHQQSGPHNDCRTANYRSSSLIFRRDEFRETDNGSSRRQVAPRWRPRAPGPRWSSTETYADMLAGKAQ